MEDSDQEFAEGEGGEALQLGEDFDDDEGLDDEDDENLEQEEEDEEEDMNIQH